VSSFGVLRTLLIGRVSSILVAVRSEHVVNCIEGRCHRRDVCSRSCKLSALSLRSTYVNWMKSVVAFDIWCVLVYDWRMNVDS